VNSESKTTYPIRYFACGEYGSKLSRPHYHVCLFNFNFTDRVLWSERENVKLYRSKQLEKLWPYGYSTIGDVTWESAAYVARYVTKKVNGDRAATHYLKDFNPETGECIYLEPEYITMSRRPGIAANWFKKFVSDCYPKDYVTHNGKKLRIPSFYDRIYDRTEPDALSTIKLARRKAACNSDHTTPGRLRARETVQKEQAKRLIRGIEV
jgi:hypothetical protein